MTEWKDATIYAQGDRARGREPDSWEARSGDLRIWVSKGHRLYPGEWVMNCYELDMTCEGIGEAAKMSPGDAQAAAVNMAVARAERLLEEAKGFLSAPPTP